MNTKTKSKLAELKGKVLEQGKPLHSSSTTTATEIAKKHPRFTPILEHLVPEEEWITHFETRVTDPVSGNTSRVVRPALATGILFRAGLLVSETREERGQELDAVSACIMAAPLKVDPMTGDLIKEKGKYVIDVNPETGKAFEPDIVSYFPLYWTFSRSSSAVKGKRTLLVSWNPRQKHGVPGLATPDPNSQQKSARWNPDWDKVGPGLENKIKALVINAERVSPQLASIVEAIPDDSSRLPGATTPQGTGLRSVAEAAAEEIPENTLA
jgi:hypothetical protein